MFDIWFKETFSFFSLIGFIFLIKFSKKKNFKISIINAFGEWNYLKNKFKEIKLNFKENYDLGDEVFEFLASEITSSIRELVGALNRVLAFSKINTKSPTIHECKKILEDFINYNNKSINVESIQNLVASYFNLNIQEMLSQRRSRALARPRQIAMYLAKQHTTNSLPDIGRKFSNRDHTTVIHAVKKIDELMKKDNEIRQNVIEIRKKFL